MSVSETSASQTPLRVTCKFVRCEKSHCTNGKAGRKYELVFAVTQSGPDGPPVGTEVVRCVWGSPGNLVKSDGKIVNLVDAMQKLSPHLHTPEQLITEDWVIEMQAGVTREYDTRYRFSGWGIRWYDAPSRVFERPKSAPVKTEAAVTAPPVESEFDPQATRDAF